MADKLLTKDIYNNPTEIQAITLANVEQKLFNGESIIADPNTPFLFLIESTCTLTAGAIEHTSNQFPALYPKRAQLMEDLYKHLSDYDYIELYATPASSSMSIILEKKQLLEKMKILKVYDDSGNFVDTNYYLAQLPKDTYIYFGPYVFGFYYPVNILITRDTELVSVNYDTTYANPLKVLSDNNLDFRQYDYQLSKLIEINLPVYQFKSVTEIIDCSKIAGLNKKLKYDNRLYAIRVYSKKNNTWIELNVVYSETMYDPNTPSIIAKVYQDRKECHLVIPQVYFDNDQIGTKIKVELFTTLGAIDIDISTLDPDQIKVDIPSQLENPLSDYAEVFNKLATFHIVPHTPIIAGGTNEADFKTIKQRILNRISTNGLLVSPGQLNTHYADLGFSIEHVTDSLEERLYAACGLLTDKDEVPMQVAMFTTEIPLAIPSYAMEHVIEGDNAVTVLPTAIFRYDPDLDRAFFINQDEKDSIERFYGQDQVGFCLYLNDNYFTRNIYHTHIRKVNKTPYLVNYDLGRPKVDALRFISENIRTAEQITVIDYFITHDCYDRRTTDSKTGLMKNHKYKLTLYTQCTAGIKELLNFNASDLKVLVSLQSSTNIELFQLAEIEPQNQSDPKYDPNKFTFNVYFEPSYEFNSKGEIALNILTQELDETVGHFMSEFTSKAYINLTPTIKVLFLANYPDIMDQSLMEFANPYGVDYKQLALQELDICLGYNLHNKLYSSVDLVYCRGDNYIDGVDNYVVSETEYAKYPEDVYARDDDGSLLVNVSYELIDSGVVKPPRLYVEENTPNGKIRCSNFEIVIGNRTETILPPKLQIENNNIAGQIRSSRFSNDYKGFSQVQTPILRIKDEAVTGSVYSTPFSIIHGCVGKIKTPKISIVTNSVQGDLLSSPFEYDVICELMQVNLDKIHNEGDLMMDEFNKPIVKYQAGDRKLDLGGNPRVHSKEIMFMANMLHVSLNLYYADRNNQGDIIKNLSDRAYSQYERIHGSSERLLENTYVVYRPFTSIGKGTFSTNSKKNISHDLGISLRFKCYIPEYSLTDTNLQRLIRVKIIEIVEDMLAAGRLSVTEVSNQIKNAFTDIIRHVDIFGINGNVNLQMLETLDKTKRPIIKQELTLDENRLISLNKSILIQFVS